jgi:hypothetical protein
VDKLGSTIGLDVVEAFEIEGEANWPLAKGRFTKSTTIGFIVTWFS